MIDQLRFLLKGFSLMYFILPLILQSAELAETDSIKLPYNINNRNILFVFRGNCFIIPIMNFNIHTFLEHSILHIPKDIVRDGLPWYGTKRDDWMEGKTVRKHLGIDIYYDSLTIVAAASGVIEFAGWNKISGGWLKIDHDNQVKTIYVHLSEITVKKGEKVKQGQMIAKINKPEGNAIGTQLHFSLQIDEKKWDTLYFIKITYENAQDVMELIKKYEKNKTGNEKLRDEKVREYKRKSASNNN
jgi:hypothetical protein